MSRYPFRKSYASISHNVLAWQLNDTLRQIGAGIAVRSTRAAVRPGVTRGAYAERWTPPQGKFERLCAQAMGVLWRQARLRCLRLRPFVQAVAAQQPAMDDLHGHARRILAEDLRQQLRQQGFRLPLVARTFALVRATAQATLGMQHFEVQLMGGWTLLHGMVAEMAAGEGKTLTATLPACTAALAGLPVHIVTVNDYLAQRDADLMRPVYQALGLTVGVIVHGLEPAARRAAYACDVTYCTNKELAFDYLKDRIVLRRNSSHLQLQLERLGQGPVRLDQLLLRGLYYAIVDEADSVLIDEARTPLIISGGDNNPPAQHVYQSALALASQLTLAHDFVIEGREHAIRLTPAGQERLAVLAPAHGGVWTGRRRREELVRQALTAQHLMQRDKHYLVQDGKVHIVDEFTGRLMPDRSWEYGLHQLVESKEACPLTGLHESLARMSYQRFFRRYLRLAGMTGTAWEVRRELWSVYRLAVVRLPTNRPLQRQHLGHRVYRTAPAKWEAIVTRVTHMHQNGRPVLVGTRSVAASEHLSRLLTAAGLPHQVLNARQDSAEAAIIAQAGEAGRITVATNMAGRGTDIRLAPGVADHGGLHVLATEGHEARRIDRQLFGRCGRQGDPGSYEMLVSLEDEIITRYTTRLWRWYGALTVRLPLTSWLSIVVCWQAQRSAERFHARLRRELLRLDEHLETALAFSGHLE